MGKLENRRILIFQQRNWGKGIGHFLAKKFQAQGCKLAALTLKRSTHNFVLDQKEVTYDLVVNNDEIMSRPKDYLKEDDYSLAEICQALDIDSIWPIVMNLRNHVMSYEDKFYYGFKQSVSDQEIIYYIKAVYKCIKFIFDKFDPEVIIAPNFVALPHIMFNLYAKKQGVKMMNVTDCKIKDIYIFAYDYRDDEGDFYDRVDVLNKGLVDSPNREKATKFIKEFRENFKKPVHAVSFSKKKSLKQRVRHELSPYYHTLKWYLKKPVNVLESTGITLDYRPPRIILRDHYCRKKYRKFMDNFNYYPLDKIDKFVYFPLQFQPEAAIDVIAAYFSNQTETARQVAMSLPGDYTLVVKEHPKMVGLRSPSYIEKIARTVNIKFVDYKIPSEEVLKRADLVVCPNGTTLSEAAFYSKPAIQLGNLGTTLKLPNVFKHTDMTTLAAKIKELLAKDFNNDEYEKKLENYIAAAYDTGFDFDYWHAWLKGEEGSEDNLWRVFKEEVEKALKPI